MCFFKSAFNQESSDWINMLEIPIYTEILLFTEKISKVSRHLLEIKWLLDIRKMVFLGKV